MAAPAGRRPPTRTQGAAIENDRQKKRVEPHKPHSPDSLVRVYSDFLIFWVILGLVVSYSIVLGIGWGTLFLKLVGSIVSADSIPPQSNPLSGLLTHRTKVVWLFVAGLIVYVFCHIRYEYATGYRLKRGVRRLLVGSLLLLSVLSAAVLSLFGLARIIS